MTNSSSLVLRSSSVRFPLPVRSSSVFFGSYTLYFRSVRYFSVTCTVRSVTCPLPVRQISGTRSVRVCSILLAGASGSGGIDFHERTTNGQRFLADFYPLDVRSRYPVRCDWAINLRRPLSLLSSIEIYKCIIMSFSHDQLLLRVWFNGMSVSFQIWGPRFKSRRLQSCKLMHIRVWSVQIFPLFNPLYNYSSR